VKDVAMHVAAANPLYVRPEEVPAELVAKEKEIAVAQMAASGKPAAVLEKIAEGKIKKFYEDSCLMQQVFVKDPNKTIEQLQKEAIAALGENIMIRRFARFQLGEGVKDAEPTA
jgi:elongation factor Ts